MREKGILKHWILRKQGLNNNIGRYRGRPIGNAPAFNDLDSNLNHDIHAAVHRHVAFTATTHCNNPRKLSIVMPKQQDASYLCL
eukprot:14783401-Ditylum_brightwellii.AAC.1